MHAKLLRWATAACACLVLGFGLEAESGRAAESGTDAIQVVASLIAIQVTCRDLEVRPGVAFQYGESHGVPLVDILPGGRRRVEFDAALAKASMIDRSELCSSVAAKFSVDLPGVIGPR